MIQRNPQDPRYKIDLKRPVFVYKNLHKDCWSVKQDGLTKAHTNEINMWDCKFQVNAKGRQRVLNEQRKNVHAGIKGYIDEFDLDLQDFLPDSDPEGQSALPPTPMPNQQVVQTAAMPAAGVMNQGLTPVENALLSEEEKQIKLRSRGLA